MTAGPEWGPLAALAGNWEGDEGIDVAYSNDRDTVAETPYREKTELKPFGPVENGIQTLYGLDYRMAAWRLDIEEENPFHTEVGYWLWDATNTQVTKCFVIPRASTILAGGSAAASAKTFTLEAEVGSAVYGICSNPFLDEVARAIRFELTVTAHEDGSFTYDECTTITHAKVEGTLLHTDKNRLRRVD